MSKREGHGFWPYWLPYFGFLGLIQVLSGAPDDVALPIKVAVPGALVLYFALRGGYEELRGFAWADPKVLLDTAVGIAGAALWMAPYLLIDAARPEPGGFDPTLYGEELVWLALGIRGLGYALVTPFVEELFVRSWLVRYVQVLEVGSRRVDFRDLPLARYSAISLAVLTVWFTVSHVPWEWPVSVAWILLTQLYFYWRKHLMALVIVHGWSNLSILLFVIAANDRFLDGEGNPIDLWFFV